MDDGSKPGAKAEVFLSADELAAAVGVSTERLARLVRLGLVEPEDPDVGAFAAASAPRLARMVRLHAQVGIRFVDAAIIVELLERLDRLEAELARLRSSMAP